MSEHPLKKKASLIMLGLMLAGVNAGGNLRTPYSDPYCNTFNSDGSCCLKCSYHYFMDAKGACQPVSDWCKTWDEKTGACTSCFQGYGNPVKGVCGSAPPADNGNVGGQNDDHCADYGFLDAKKTWRSVWSAGCTKVCIECDEGYFLTPSYKCVFLPQNCAVVNDDGKCTACDDGFDLNAKGQCCKNVVAGNGNDDESSKDDCKDDHKKGHRRRRGHHNKHDKQSDSKYSDKDSDSKKQDCQSDKKHFGKDGKGKLHKFRKNHDDNSSESYEWDSKLKQWKGKLGKLHGKFDKDSKGHDKDSKGNDKDSKSCEEESRSHQSKSHQSESHQSKSRETDCESTSHSDHDSKKFGHASRAEFQFGTEDAEEPVEPQEPEETEEADAV